MQGPGIVRIAPERLFSDFNGVGQAPVPVMGEGGFDGCGWLVHRGALSVTEMPNLPTIGAPWRAIKSPLT
jgi:hypothetical protein